MAPPVSCKTAPVTDAPMPMPMSSDAIQMARRLQRILVSLDKRDSIAFGNGPEGHGTVNALLVDEEEHRISKPFVRGKVANPWESSLQRLFDGIPRSPEGDGDAGRLQHAQRWV